MTDATITHDMIQRDNAVAEIVGTSIGNDLTFGDFAGADISKSTVGHDIVAGGTDSGAGITDSSIGHDFVGRERSRAPTSCGRRSGTTCNCSAWAAGRISRA